MFSHLKVNQQACKLPDFHSSPDTSAKQCPIALYPMERGGQFSPELTLISVMSLLLGKVAYFGPPKPWQPLPNPSSLFSVNLYEVKRG
jgi:hypothetical protein